MKRTMNATMGELTKQRKNGHLGVRKKNRGPKKSPGNTSARFNQKRHGPDTAVGRGGKNAWGGTYRSRSRGWGGGGAVTSLMLLQVHVGGVRRNRLPGTKGSEKSTRGGGQRKRGKVVAQWLTYNRSGKARPLGNPGELEALPENI